MYGVIYRKGAGLLICTAYFKIYYMVKDISMKKHFAGIYSIIF